MDKEDISILLDMALSMATYIMAKCFTSGEIAIFFEAHKDRLRLQGFEENKINRLSTEMMGAVTKLGVFFKDIK